MDASAAQALYRCVSRAAATETLEFDARAAVAKHCFQPGEFVQALQHDRTASGGQRVRTANGWVSLVAARGTVLLEPVHTLTQSGEPKAEGDAVPDQARTPQESSEAAAAVSDEHAPQWFCDVCGNIIIGIRHECKESPGLFAVCPSCVMAGVAHPFPLFENTAPLHITEHAPMVRNTREAPTRTTAEAGRMAVAPGAQRVLPATEGETKATEMAAAEELEAMRQHGEPPAHGDVHIVDTCPVIEDAAPTGEESQSTALPAQTRAWERTRRRVAARRRREQARRPTNPGGATGRSTSTETPPLQSTSSQTGDADGTRSTSTETPLRQSTSSQTEDADGTVFDALHQLQHGDLSPGKNLARNEHETAPRDATSGTANTGGRAGDEQLPPEPVESAPGDSNRQRDSDDSCEGGSNHLDHHLDDSLETPLPRVEFTEDRRLRSAATALRMKERQEHRQPLAAMSDYRVQLLALARQHAATYRALRVKLLAEARRQSCANDNGLRTQLLYRSRHATGGTPASPARQELAHQLRVTAWASPAASVESFMFDARTIQNHVHRSLEWAITCSVLTMTRHPGCSEADLLGDYNGLTQETVLEPKARRRLQGSLAAWLSPVSMA